MRGIIVHDMLEAHYLKKDPWKQYRKAEKEYAKLFRVEREEYGDLLGDLKSLMTGYFNFYKKDVKVIEVEKEFRVRLPQTKIHLIGKIDLVAKDQDLKWIMEHKCQNQIPQGSTVPYTNLQSNSYIWAYEQETGKKLDGVLWNYLWGKRITKPQILKDGTMSKRHLAITWPMYRQALKDNNLDVSDYLDIKSKLQGNESTFFQRKYLPINKKMVTTVLEDTVTTAQEIQQKAGKDRTRNLNRHCDFCEFKDLCLSDLKGLDTNFIIKANFKERKKDERNRSSEDII